MLTPREQPVHPKPTATTAPTVVPVDALALELGLDNLNIDVDGGNVGDVATVGTPLGGEVVESFEMELLRAEMNELRDELKAAREEKATLQLELENLNSDKGAQIFYIISSLGNMRF